MRRWFGALIVLVMTGKAAAQAHSTTSPAAEALYNEGRKLLDAGRYSEACSKLEESQRLDPATGTEFFLADCYEKAGRITTAWQLFRDVEASARNAGRTDRLDVAKKRADGLEPRVSKLVVEVPWAEKLPGGEVHRVAGNEDVLLGHAQWGMAVPVDPGRYTLKATAPGRKPLETSLDVPEGKTTTVTIPEPANLPVQTTVPVAEQDRGAGLRTAGWVVGGAGLATLAAGTILGLVGVAQYGDSSAECANNLCTQKGLDIRAGAITLANVGTAVFFVGVAAVAAGTFMVLLAPRAPSARTGIAPFVGPGSLGLFGRF